jgi:hypothetical protein
MHFCPCLRKLHTTSTKPPKFDIPLMDLSSLEGPPVDNPRLCVPPNPTNPRIHIHSPPPDTSITNILVWKPLPPAPTSTNTASQRQYQRRNDWPSGPSVDPNLRRSPAHRGRRSPGPSNEIFPDYHPQQARELPSLTSSNVRSSSLPRRPQTCLPLVWLEDEEYWIVGDRDRPRIPEPQTRNRSLSSTSSPISPISSMSPFQIDSSFSPSPGRVSADRQLDQPPPYDSHRYGSMHAARLRDAQISRWIDIAERRQNLPA